MAFAGGAGAQGAVVHRVDAELHVDVEAARVEFVDLPEGGLALKGVVLGDPPAEDADRGLALGLGHPLQRRHGVDIGRHVEDELEGVAEDGLELHDVQEDAAVLGRAHKDRHAALPGRGEEAVLVDADARLDLVEALAELRVELRRRHGRLEVGLRDEPAEEAVRAEEHVLRESDVVDADDPRRPQGRVPRIGGDLA